MREKERRKKTKIDSAVITSKTKDKKAQENPRKSIGLSFISFLFCFAHTQKTKDDTTRERNSTHRDRQIQEI